LPTQQKTTRTLQCSYELQRKRQGGWWVPKEAIQVAPGGKKSHIACPYPGIGKLGFRMGLHGAAWKDHLSELADYRKTTTAMFLRATKKTPSWLGLQPKGLITVASRKNHKSLLPVFRIG
jgi:hypothetical protein